MVELGHFGLLPGLIWVIAAFLLWSWYRNSETRVMPGGGHKFMVLNNWLLLILTFIIFVGTLFPFFKGLINLRVLIKPLIGKRRSKIK